MLTWSRAKILPVSRVFLTLRTLIHQGSTVALPKLPFTKEMAELLMEHIVCVQGLPNNLVFDQSPSSLTVIGRPSASSWGPLYSGA